MRIEYTEIGEDSAQRKVVDAVITKRHPLSSYGQPVILVDGIPFDYLNWVFTGARPLMMNQKEFALFEKWQQGLDLGFIVTGEVKREV